MVGCVVGERQRPQHGREQGEQQEQRAAVKAARPAADEQGEQQRQRGQQNHAIGRLIRHNADVAQQDIRGQPEGDLVADGGDSVLPQHEKVEPPFQHPHAGIAERPADATQERLPHQAAEGNRRFRLQRNQENQREAERNDGERQQIEVVDEQADQREKNGQTDASG